MRPMVETVNVAANTSFKVETYSNSHSCGSAGWHIHPEYELVFVRNGSGSLRIGTEKRSYANGALVFLGGNIPHADFGNKDREDNLEVVVQFKKEFLEEKIKVFPELTKIKKLVEKSKQVLLFGEEVHHRLGNDFLQFRKLDEQGSLVKLLYLLDELSKNVPYETLFDSFTRSTYKRDEIKRLEDTFEYVNERYDQNISVSEIANRIGLTPNSFCRFFKRMTQKTFIGFVNEFRVEKAVELFREENTSISEVMYRSGFNDPSYFARQFKKYQGQTPSEYLKGKYS
ncbi:AraC family transcriptional regulator [Flagellimonas allohymeniacidonis]|uniref:AraC family transcriptional regulator n=1 Tax=Flagellimonas allohymeniacidonis TaxID=2517819 RepID=A0A4Q8Q953_9FLAO|nr:AraC family transcriptional regulator [Allomuricauda hymeniacidonis]TAI46785.1 AraC family transcriptional regulator [Allomuricauda hymeniacidonis]